MNPFLWNIFMAVIWALASGEFSVTGLAVGFLLGYAVLWLGGELVGASRYCRRGPRLLKLVLFFLWEVILANLRVARDVMMPKHRLHPGIIALPLETTTDVETMLLASMITRTPGSLTVDVSSDRRVMYIHIMNLRGIDEQKRRLKDGFERRLLEALQ